MAASGPLADFAKLPTQRKVMVFAVIGLLVGLLYWKFVFKSLNDDVEAAEGEHDAKVALNKKLALDIPLYEELKTNNDRLRHDIEKNQAALPNEAEVPAFFETLEHKVTESGVEINKWNKRPEEPVEAFVKVPVEVELTGTFLQIKRFFSSLIPKEPRALLPGEDKQNEEHERIVSIENLTLSNPVVKNRELILSAKFTAVTYRQEDHPEPPPPAPGAPPPPPKPATAPASPPGQPAPSSAPPMPSAGTPAGAKARTEDALKKGDERNRNATGVDEAKTPAVAPTPAAGSAKLKGGM